MEEEASVRRRLEYIANHATRSEKVAWDRKRSNMDRLVGHLRPLEDQILEIRSLMQPIYDEIAELRQTMVDECVHPYDMLINNNDGTITCKFCNKTMKTVDCVVQATVESSLDDYDNKDI